MGIQVQVSQTGMGWSWNNEEERGRFEIYWIHSIPLVSIFITCNKIITAGPNPTITSYNASAAKIYNATNGIAHLLE
jgi:hypothetical protein